MDHKQQLSSFNNAWYDPGAGFIKRFLWYCTNECLFRSGFPVNGIKVFLLRLFGAKVGKGVVLKPHINIKYPWKLSIGNHVWIGEEAWIDNLAEVTIGDNVCISQGAMLLCGNHDYKKTTFDLMPGKISLEPSCWIGAKSVVCPNVTVGQNAVLAVGSVASSNLEPNFIYRGNPAQQVKERL